MELKCTKEEFKALLDLVYAGNLLINGMREVDERILPHSEMEQKIFAMAKEFGYEELIEFDNEFNEYMPTRAYENSEVNDYIDAYEDKVFWEELVVRMARRQALNELGDENPDMTSAELRQRQIELEEYYEDEFIENGIYHLKWIRPEIQSEEAAKKGSKLED
ncbi:hypothetical protein PBV87_12025 [Niameybacter massiliensis]|uniref:Uncharacterized protein n=1 Tax=Holtiella tumoricola TaxID=3018743 RepID=A0AA42J160_9FIRM|nr:hypothetical protein [Holtiella tumoricola]MDA3732212.1 hypothetical protein [Holtiella tumoricola]